MCSLQEHSARPEYKLENDIVWQKVDGQWVNITPGHVEASREDS